MYSLLLKKSGRKSNYLLGKTRLKLQPKWPPNNDDNLSRVSSKDARKISTVVYSKTILPLKMEES